MVVKTFDLVPGMSPAERPVDLVDVLAPTAGALAAVDVFDAPTCAGCCAATPNTPVTTNSPTVAEKTRCMILLYSYRSERSATVVEFIRLYRTLRLFVVVQA